MNNNIFQMFARSFSKHIRTELFPAKTVNKRTFFQLRIMAIILAIFILSYLTKNKVAFTNSMAVFGFMMLIFGADQWVNRGTIKNVMLKKIPPLFCFQGILIILIAIIP